MNQQGTWFLSGALLFIVGSIFMSPMQSIIWGTVLFLIVPFLLHRSERRG